MTDHRQNSTIKQNGVGDYGPWIMVQRGPGSREKKKSQVQPQNKGKDSNRYAAISELNGEMEGNEIFSEDKRQPASLKERNFNDKSHNHRGSILHDEGRGNRKSKQKENQIHLHSFNTVLDHGPESPDQPTC